MYIEEQFRSQETTINQYLINIPIFIFRIIRHRTIIQIKQKKV